MDAVLYDFGTILKANKMTTFHTTFLAKKKIQIFISTISLLFLGPSVSFAQLSPECEDMKYIKSKATKVVHGEVIDVQSRKEENGQIYTFIKIKVNKYIEGEGPQSIIIKQFGGTIEENGQTIQSDNVDSPIFKIGESGYFYLVQPGTPFYAGQFYGTVCSSGVIASEPQNTD